MFRRPVCDKLSWKHNTKYSYKEDGHSSLFSLEAEIILCQTRVAADVLFFRFVWRSDFCFLSLGKRRGISKHDKGVIGKITKRIGGDRMQDSFESLGGSRMTKKLNDIMSDVTHPPRQESESPLIMRNRKMRVYGRLQPLDMLILLYLT